MSVTNRTRVLVVEDDSTFREILSDHLTAKGFDTVIASSISEARALTQTIPPEIIILDQRLPDGDGVALAQELLSIGLPTRIILVTAHADLTRAIAATRAGVFDYLQKPIELEALDETILRAKKAAEFDRQWLKPSRRRTNSTPPVLVGSNPITIRLRNQLEAAGRACPAPVLVTGETGSGKNLAARLIHSHSPRARGPFVEVNCAAIPDSIFEAELFGNERGAFTGAVDSRPGLFETAHGGTLVLDEIGEIPLLVQSKLLRALEEGVVRRIGAVTERPTDVRVVATTNRCVEELVEKGEFRRDLYYRIAVFRIELPPLRERTTDISLLAWTLLSELEADSTLRPTTKEIECLCAHDWPGNIRELRNVLQRWLASRASGDMTPIEFFLNPLASRRSTHDESNVQSGINSSCLRDATLAHERSALIEFPTLAQVETRHISRAMQHVGNNQSRAADLLGISRSTLRRKIREIGGQ
jgi:DNA-binding NtrC family response regulator